MRRIAAVLAVAALAGCGSAQAATHSWQTTDFSKLRVEGPFDVKVHTGVPAGVRATGDQSAIDHVSVEQHGDTLVIRPIRQSGWNWNGRTKLVIEVGARRLAATALIGSGDVAIDRVRGDAFDAALSGSGNMSIGEAAVLRMKATLGGSGDLTLAGRADEVTAAVDGSGNLHGDGFTADRAQLTLAGSGDLTIGARRAATVSLGGSGDITVLGDATCTVARSGLGSVKCAHGGSSGDD